MYLTVGVDNRDEWIKQAAEHIRHRRYLFYVRPFSVARVMFATTYRQSAVAEARRLAEQIYDTRDVFIKRSETILCQHYFLKG